jgi:hypothetical protein
MEHEMALKRFGPEEPLPRLLPALFANIPDPREPFTPPKEESFKDKDAVSLLRRERVTASV